MNPKVEFFFNKEDQWQEAFKKLRAIVLETGLTEELKWGQPCYTYIGKNVVLIHGFKEYCALLFFKGVLMKDPKKILIQQTENVQVTRQIRFTNVQDIVNLKTILKTYIFEAVKVEESGKKVVLKTTSDFAVPEEFQKRLDKNKTLKKAFEALTPGRQRAYLHHFSKPKQSQTRESRIEKWIPQILDGKGLNN